ITLTLKSSSVEVNYPSESTDGSGFFTVSVAGLPNGAYAWRAKGPKYLATSGNLNLRAPFREAGDPVTNAEMGLQNAGDADNNNVVNTGDFSILRSTFGLSSGQPDYDDRADFSADHVVNATDFNLLRANFGQGGAPPIWPTGP